ncbi:MAG: hypothetical protein ACP5RH_20115, partial [Leptodesmis sp.]|uniref:hypothetical protein n=1 Tax=Leptodesmis sp. TaxID=3100501 RepID=UPI003D147DBA
GVTSSSPRLSSATTRVGGIPGELNKKIYFSVESPDSDSGRDRSFAEKTDSRGWESGRVGEWEG